MENASTRGSGRGVASEAMLFASLRTSVAEPFPPENPPRELQHYRSLDNSTDPSGRSHFGRNSVAPVDIGKPRGRGRGSTLNVPNPPFYDLLLGLQIVMGIWPGCNVVAVWANAFLVWALVFCGFVAEFVLLSKYRLWSAMFQLSLKVVTIATCLVFAWKYFGREHGFEYLVALVRRGCNISQSFHRQNYRAAFSRMSITHVLLGVAAAVALAVLEIYDLTFDLEGLHVNSYVVKIIRLSLVLRAAFRVAFLMFFSITCWLHRLIINALLDQIDDDRLDLEALHARFSSTLVSLRATSSSFQLVISVIIMEAAVQLLDLSWQVMSSDSSRGLAYLVANICYQGLKIVIVLTAPAMVSKCCSDVLCRFNSRLAAAQFTPAEAAAESSDFWLRADRLRSYFVSSDFYMAVFGVRLGPQAAAVVACGVVSWVIFCCWHAAVDS
eukprot:c8451_g1_i1.p1 GENE.c8451_g1_i1~~c8451_g1_i1.p1  ORF type:complete len:440 (+),score=64.22 c8451_g1_i1:90-1409(+)